MDIYYTYKISFPTGHYYIGRRKCPKGTTPEEDSYLGSPYTNKEFWENHTAQKEILEVLDNCQDHILSEERHLGERWREDPLCLNSSPANGTSNAGLVWCNDGVNDYMLPEIPEGYVSGRIGTAAKGKRYFTNGNQSKMFFVGEEPDGWVLGNHNSKGPNNAWHGKRNHLAGKRNYTNGHQNIYIGEGEEIPAGFVIGRHVPESVREKLSAASRGVNNPRYGSRGEKWYNNGKTNKLCVPGSEPPGYVRGQFRHGRKR